MKPLLQTKEKNAGFTIVEVIIAIMVLAVFFTLLMYLYNRSSDSFKITLWKQKKTAQSTLFWSHMRKQLEQATHELEVDPGGFENPEINVINKPFIFHPDPNSVSADPVMAWNSSMVKFNFDSLKHTVEHHTVVVKKSGQSLELLVDEKSISRLTDLDSIDFKVTSIKKNDKNEEFLEDGPDPTADGTIIEITVVYKPPEKYMASSQKITQNHKFRLNVGALTDTSPTY